MQLQGNLREFSLPNIFQLVKMSAKTGALTIQRENESGKIFFRNGQIYFAFAVPQAVPLGERLVKAGKITAAQLEKALAEQRASSEGARLGKILLEKKMINRATLESAVREQIEDATFNFFSWTDGEFAFNADEIGNEDIVVELSVENVIMEGCRRIDEWELIIEQLGSLERVPHLSYDVRVEERGELKLTPEDWRVICCIDGRRDVNTVLHDCGLDRFHGAKVVYGLHSAGLVMVAEPALEGIGKGNAVAVRGAIDTYNEVFVNTLADANVTKHLRVEVIDEREVEIPIFAGTLPSVNGDDGDTLVFTASASSPDEAWRRLAGESSAFILLANANSDDSLRAAKKDLGFVKRLGNKPMVVATYVSMGDEPASPKVIQKTLGLEPGVPIMACSLRDRDSVTAIVRRAVELATL